MSSGPSILYQGATFYPFLGKSATTYNDALYGVEAYPTHTTLCKLGYICPCRTSENSAKALDHYIALTAATRQGMFSHNSDMRKMARAHEGLRRDPDFSGGIGARPDTWRDTLTAEMSALDTIIKSRIQANEDVAFAFHDWFLRRIYDHAEDEAATGEISSCTNYRRMLKKRLQTDGPTVALPAELDPREDSDVCFYFTPSLTILENCLAKADEYSSLRERTERGSHRKSSRRG